MIRDARASDAEALCAIYNPYVRDTFVTFEEVEVTTAEMAARIADVTETFPWLVVEQGGELMGYAYAKPFGARAAYRSAAESAIYMRMDAIGRGHGRALYGALLTRLRERGLHTVVGVVSLPNPASVALHEACGFKKVGHLSEIGLKRGRRLDLGYWQCWLGS